MISSLNGGPNRQSISNPTPSQSLSPVNPLVNLAVQDPLSPVATSTPPGRPSPRQRRSQMVHFPPDVWDKIASCDLSSADISRLSALDEDLKSTLEPRLKLKECAGADQASRFNSLTEMNSILEEISTLRPDIKLELMGQMMLRLHALPQQDRAAGLVSLRAAVDDTALEIEHRPSEPPGLDLICNYRDATSAVLAGERVDTIARIFDITSLLGIWNLESNIIETNGAAYNAMVAGGTTRDVAKRFGITTPWGFSRLEEITASLIVPGTAGYQVANGGKVQSVATQFEITSPFVIVDLERLSVLSDNVGTAGYEMVNGGNVQTVAAQFEITLREGLEALELRTVHSSNIGTAGHAIEHGANLQTVAAQFGITSPIGLQELELRSIRSVNIGTAGHAIRSGGTVKNVAKQFGITSPEGIRRLKSLSIWRSDNPEAPLWNVGKKIAYFFGQGHRLR